MDYEAIDRDMSSWVVYSDKNGTRFYLTCDGLGTDRLELARRYRYHDKAETAAQMASTEKAWARWGFPWRPISVPGAMTCRERKEKTGDA